MCNVYRPPGPADVALHFSVDTRDRVWPATVHPRTPGPFIRRAGGERELVVGQWALIPPWSKEPKLKYSTNNARSEEVAEKASYKDAWRRGQRCIIPALDFDEPCWETGKNVWWKFRRADGLPWGMAGLWNTWVDHATGEIHESYTMLTINADAHPLMRRMHKPDPKLPPDQQDKRSVIPIEMENLEQWLAGTVNDAQALLKLAPAEVFDAESLISQ